MPNDQLNIQKSLNLGKDRIICSRTCVSSRGASRHPRGVFAVNEDTHRTHLIAPFQKIIKKENLSPMGYLT